MKRTNVLVLILLLSVVRTHVKGQELEPRLYAALPKKMNAVAIVYGFSSGNVVVEPSLPISGFKITAHNAGLGYVRTFAIAKKLSRIQLTIPFVSMSGNLTINDRDTSAIRSGFGDARIRFGVNLLGTPAYDRSEFKQYTQKTIVGVSLVTSVPIGTYLEDKRINTGNNRWAFKPEVGVSKRIGRFYVEGYTGVWFFTNNKEFLENKTLHQEPVFSLQGHVSYYFRNQMWISLNATWFDGGKTIVDGIPNGQALDNWRVGGVFSFPLGKGHSLKIQYHDGAFTSRGYDYRMVLLAYQWVFF